MIPLLRRLLAVVAVLAAAGGLLAAGKLPDLPPPMPPPLSDSEREAEWKQQTIAVDRYQPGDAEIPAVRLLDHLREADRKHPDLVAAYRALSYTAPSQWQHYLDPWSHLPAAIRPLRVIMNFASYDVRGYAATADASGPQPARILFGSDRSMNATQGVNESRLSLFAPVPTAVSFPVAVPEGAFLTYGAGVTVNSAKGPVFFVVEVTPQGGTSQVVARAEVPVLRRQVWQAQRVDLSAYAGQSVQLTLRSEGPKGAFAFFANPILFRPRTKRPGKNVVFILIDTLRADGVHSVTGRHAMTPHVDALAARGAVFTQAHSLASWTRTSLLSMFTSEYTSRFSWELNTAFWMPLPLRQRMYDRWPRLLTWHLKEQGYLVEAIVNNFFLLGFTPIGFDRGYDHVTDIRAQIYDTPAITRGAVRFLRQNRRRPFFLYLHYDGPHAPYYVPAGYAVKGARPEGGPNDQQYEYYLGEMRWTDEHLQPIFAELKQLGLDRNTLVVLTADHGEIFHSAHDVIYGENNRTLHNHGFSLYQEVTHVPLIITAEGTVPPGLRVNEPVTHLDLAPTILELPACRSWPEGWARASPAHCSGASRCPSGPS
jgi:hypothetical protein